ncbi:MAG: hypothetical protein LBH13_02645 [Cellulomonadaceae bacterium]|jgi:hypothetical protein|nr:hypothetical protein [Cellulomonadaceae bacterium]
MPELLSVVEPASDPVATALDAGERPAEGARGGMLSFPRRVLRGIGAVFALSMVMAGLSTAPASAGEPDGSYQNPFPAGVNVVTTNEDGYDDWQVTIKQPYEAWSKVKAASSKNKAPAPGMEYWMVPISGKNLDADYDHPGVTFFVSMLTDFGEEYVDFVDDCGVIPNALEDLKSVPQGKSFSANSCIEIPKGAHGLFILNYVWGNLEGFWDDAEDGTWWSNHYGDWDIDKFYYKANRAWTDGSVKIHGTAKVGSTLTAKVSAFSPQASQYTYQWLRDGKAIKGATKATYGITSGDLGKRITVTTTAKRAGYFTRTVTSAAVKPAQGTFSQGSVVISGTKKVGKKLTAKPTGFSPKPAKYAYQWLRNGKAIKGATKKTYKAKSADANTLLSVKVTAATPGFAKKSATTGGAWIAAAKNKAPLKRFHEASHGGGGVGIDRSNDYETLIADPWFGDPKPAAYTYQWYYEGKAVKGATKKSFKPKDVHRVTSVKVTAHRPGYHNYSVTDNVWETYWMNAINPKAKGDGGEWKPYRMGTEVRLDAGVTMTMNKVTDITAKLKKATGSVSPSSLLAHHRVFLVDTTVTNKSSRKFTFKDGAYFWDSRSGNIIDVVHWGANYFGGHAARPCESLGRIGKVSGAKPWGKSTTVKAGKAKSGQFCVTMSNNGPTKGNTFSAQYTKVSKAGVFEVGTAYWKK